MLVELLSLWRRANFQRGRRTLCGYRACWSALALAPCEFLMWIVKPPAVFGGCPRWRVERPANSVWNRRVAALARGAFCEFRLEATTLSLISAGGSAGVKSALTVLFKVDEPLTVLCRCVLMKVSRRALICFLSMCCVGPAFPCFSACCARLIFEISLVRQRCSDDVLLCTGVSF